MLGRPRGIILNAFNVKLQKKYVPTYNKLFKLVVSPFAMLKDDQARTVDTYPTKAAYDPREILDPTNGDGCGLFDRGTFDEVQLSLFFHPRNSRF